MLITCRLIFLELKRRHSVLLGLADNLLATCNQEKTSLMQDSIIDLVDDASQQRNREMGNPVTK